MEEFESLSEKLARVTAECERLNDENARLRALLGVRPVPTGDLAEGAVTQVVNEAPHVNSIGAIARPTQQVLSEASKIALFQSLFRGREDVYATRWEKNGKAGYSPECIHDWNAVFAVAPAERKKRDKETRRLVPLTDITIERHLRGQITIGLYPLLADETCWFLAVDFDQEAWEQDSLAFLEVSRELSVPAARERSRSGKGAHVWIFFATPIPAVLARKLGAGILTKTMERRHRIGLSSYDRCFPIKIRCPQAVLEI